MKEKKKKERKKKDRKKEKKKKERKKKDRKKESQKERKNMGRCGLMDTASASSPHGAKGLGFNPPWSQKFYICNLFLLMKYRLQMVKKSSPQKSQPSKEKRKKKERKNVGQTISFVHRPNHQSLNNGTLQFLVTNENMGLCLYIHHI